MTAWRLAALGCAFVAGVAPAAAQETRYIDDRSDAASLIQSLYNAVNRREYARAWGYFGETKPSADLDAFARGYESTQQVNVITGDVATEGAAGTTYYHLPVSIISFARDGSDTVFAGCYVLRLASPEVQGEPFQPLAIERGSLQRSDLSYEEALPAACPDAPTPETVDRVLNDARKAFQETHAECDRNLPGADPATAEVEDHTITYRYESDAEGDPERTARLFRFYCGTGAYNENHVYYLWDDVDGLREQHFARPDLKIEYENGDTDGKVENVAIVGYHADGKLVNSFYDPASLSVKSHAKWRGVGDASSSGTWLFRNGAFTLVRYEVDASYDGEINPEAVLDYDTAP